MSFSLGLYGFGTWYCHRPLERKLWNALDLSWDSNNSIRHRLELHKLHLLYHCKVLPARRDAFGALDKIDKNWSAFRKVDHLTTSPPLPVCGLSQTGSSHQPASRCRHDSCDSWAAWLTSPVSMGGYFFFSWNILENMIIWYYFLPCQSISCHPQPCHSYLHAKIQAQSLYFPSDIWWYCTKQG